MKTFSPLLLTCLPIGLLFGFVSCSSDTTGPDQQAPVIEEIPAEPTGLAPELFERIALIGASSTAGFNLQLETGVPTRLADFIDQALLVPHAIAYDGSTSMLFLDPEAKGKSAAEGALAANPSLLIAPDFLFWFFYGRGSNAVDRQLRLEAGLGLLEPFECPLVIGEIPFMGSAAGGMIPHSSMPAEDSFAAANERIHEWAQARGNTSVVPLVSLNQTLKSGAVYERRGVVWDPAERGGLLQADHLHPNMSGAAIMALEVLGSLAKTQSATLEGVALADPEEIADLVDDLVSSR